MHIVENDAIDETLDSAFEEEPDDELVNPIRHYIKEMGGMALLTRTGEKDIARQMENAREEIKQVILSFPGTVKELLDALVALKNSRAAVRDITLDVDEEDEDEGVELEFQRERVINLLEKLRYEDARLRRNSCGNKDKCRAEIHRIITELNLGRRITEKLLLRMRRSVDKIARIEEETRKCSRTKRKDAIKICEHERERKKLNNEIGINTRQLKM
jgi:RNA polymerase primary sigma factor